MATINKQWLLASRPAAEATVGNFRLVETPVPALAEGQVLVRHHYLSLDPYMRMRMNDAKNYAAPVAVGEVMVGNAGAMVSMVNGTGEAPALTPADVVEVAVTEWPPSESGLIASQVKRPLASRSSPPTHARDRAMGRRLGELAAVHRDSALAVRLDDRQHIERTQSGQPARSRSLIGPTCSGCRQAVGRSIDQHGRTQVPFQLPVAHAGDSVPRRQCHASPPSLDQVLVPS